MKLKYEINLGRGDKTAILQCLVKWEIVESLHGGGNDYAAQAVGDHSDNCALCKMYDPDDICACRGCPLFEATGKNCCNDGSVYSQWHYNPSKDTANTMVETLKTLLGKSK